MPWLCDEMLGRLARLLRAAGEDVLQRPAGTSDPDLLACAKTEDRRLVTSDRRLAASAGERAVLIRSGSPEDQAIELGRQFRLDWRNLRFTRCLIDNALLRAAAHDEIAALPGNRSDRFSPFRTCLRCGRIYWSGGHVRRLDLRLDRIAARSEATAGTESAPAGSPNSILTRRRDEPCAPNR